MSSPDERPPCPECRGVQVRKMTWAIRSLPNEPRHEAPLTYECQACGHVWRIQAVGAGAGAEPPRATA